MAKEIIVTIPVSGAITVETKGFQGATCLKETEDLERKLGGATKITPTGEMNARANNAATVKAGR